MYRIELSPGEETVFRTVEELAIGIRNGLITPRARIYHNTSQKWLPIEFHPHYKKALEMPAPRPPVAPPVTAPIPLPAVSSPIADLPTISYDSAPMEAEAEPIVRTTIARLRRHQRRPFCLAVAATALVVGTYLAVSAAMPDGNRAGAPSSPQNAAAATQTTRPMPPVDSTAPSFSAAPAGTSSPALGPPAPSPRARTNRTLVSSIRAGGPAAVIPDSTPGIEPAPAEVDLAVPALVSSDSLALVTRDSSAIGRILRAVGGKEPPLPTTPP
jgi:hypothetical protein